MADWMQTEVQRFEHRLRLRRIYHDFSMWLWPIVAISLALYCWAKALF